MSKKIEQHLTECPSYFKWSTRRLAVRFKCSEKTISNIVAKLAHVKQDYLRNLNF